MRRLCTAAPVAVMLMAGSATTAAAQLDYRNLDDGRPLWVEDAWPVERRALELLVPYSVRWGHGSARHGARPEVAWGAWDNLMLGVKLPFALDRTPAGDHSGLAGPGAFLFYNLSAEGRRHPAVAVRAEAHLPWGALAPDGTELTVKGIATRTLGRERLHLNLAWTALHDESGQGAPGGRWAAGVAMDRTLFRSSTLIATELRAADGGPAQGVQWGLGVGFRRQWTPTLVLDAGVSRELARQARSPWTVTVGVSHAVGTGRRRAGTTPARGQTTRAEWHYLPGGFNWQFLSRYPEAARLFNAFDYGHAVLYERLWGAPEDAVRQLEEVEFDFLTRDLLVRPPRFAVAEDVVEPAYARVALEAKRMFEWAHLLHRQLYDVYADDRLTREEQRELAERLTDDYQRRSDLAFTDQPKAMALMDDQPFSQYFRRHYPRMNGLIWAYHWLQVGLYEPLIAEDTPTGRKAGVTDALTRFWAMADSAPARFPAVMPMASAVAPEFSRAHPRAAAIFDNLHMMHDIISDILANPAVPREEKPDLIRAQLAEFRNGSTNLMGMEHWWMMGPMMGGVERMGGVAGRVRK